MEATMIQNSSQIQSLLLPILIILLIGIVTVTGWLTWFLTRSRKRRATENNLVQSQDILASADIHSVNSPSPAYILGLKPDPVGGWEIYVKGKRCRSLTAISEPQIREEVTSALKTLVGFAEGVVQPSQPAELPVETASPPVTTTVQPMRSTASASPTLPLPVQTASAGAAAPAEPSTRRITPLRGSLPTIDFAYEINRILEEILTRTPTLQDHTIVLQNIPGGINFFVDGATYDEITDIPSAEIQALIRQATREWERR
jgi:hypothetical protein